MAVPKLQYNPIRAPKGKLVHAMAFGAGASEAADVETACGKDCAKGWCMALSERLTCKKCIAAVFYPVRGARKRVR